MKSILVIGMSRFGRHLATKLQDLGNEVMIIDKDEDVIAELSDKFTDAQIGDCTNQNVLVAIGVDTFDDIFVAIGEDFQASLVITLLLKQLGAKMVISRAKQDIQAMLLRQIGADEIVYPEKDTAVRLAICYNNDKIFDYIPLTAGYSIYEITVPEKWMEKSVRDVDARNKYNINIISVKNGTYLNPMPNADYVFKPSDHIVVVGKQEYIERLNMER